jgi:hypothetical protein
MYKLQTGATPFHVKGENVDKSTVIQAVLTVGFVLTLFLVFFSYLSLDWVTSILLSFILSETVILVPLYFLFFRNIKKWGKMKRKVQISVYEDQGLSRMTDYEDGKLLVELYDPDVDQEQSLIEFAEKLGYVIIDECEYERQQ